jgi:hypothetical protein
MIRSIGIPSKIVMRDTCKAWWKEATEYDYDI